MTESEEFYLHLARNSGEGGDLTLAAESYELLHQSRTTPNAATALESLQRAAAIQRELDLRQRLRERHPGG